MKTAIYAFSGDPITYGHINIINRAKQVFDRVIVAIGVNPKKKYTFSLAERKNMAKTCFSDPDIKIMSFSNLLIDFAYEQGADVIIKGIRNAADFDYENVLDVVGKSQKVGIDTHVLFADPEYAHVSSTAAKEIAAYNGNLSNYVPLHVKQALEESLNCGNKNQIIIGLTGEIGSGKTHIGEILSRYKYNAGMMKNVHNIELDHIGHDILCKLTEPAYIKVRQQIQDTMGHVILNSDGFVDRNVLGSIVFRDYEKLKMLNEILEKPIMVRLRQELVKKDGIILINCALLSEAHMLHICNNNVILITVDKDTQKKRLIERGLSEEQIQARLDCQYTQEHKKIDIQNDIDTSRHGNLWEIDNSNDISKDMLYKQFEKIIW